MRRSAIGVSDCGVCWWSCMIVRSVARSCADAGCGDELGLSVAGAAFHWQPQPRYLHRHGASIASRRECGAVNATNLPPSHPPACAKTTCRPALLEAGLQRVELGSIASKIGQLYYNHYMRSGDVGALLESYVFYDAILSRQYFGSSADAAQPSAAARQLRFYARFIVVCLLLNRKEVRCTRVHGFDGA